MLGEDIDPKEIKALFHRVDRDGSGKIEFDEFGLLVKGMNPQEGFEEELKALEATTETTYPQCLKIQASLLSPLSINPAMNRNFLEPVALPS